MKKVVFLLALALFTMPAVLSAQEQPAYYFSKTIKGSFEEVTKRTKDALKEQGFGVVTEIDMDETLREKLEDVDMKPYKILGVCSPKYAYQTIQHEENIGLFLPCKVLVKYIDEKTTEVVMVNPSVLMKMLGNEDLVGVAEKVTTKFKKALESLN